LDTYVLLYQQEKTLNIATILQIEDEEEMNHSGNPPSHDMVVRLRGSAIIVEDANWILHDEQGNPLRSLPSFRVFLDARRDGVHVSIWKQGTDIDTLPPDLDFQIAGWEHGPDPTLEG
jgi:hypothetical protein